MFISSSNAFPQTSYFGCEWNFWTVIFFSFSSSLLNVSPSLGLVFSQLTIDTLIHLHTNGMPLQWKMKMPLRKADLKYTHCYIILQARFNLFERSSNVQRHSVCCACEMWNVTFHLTSIIPANNALFSVSRTLADFLWQEKKNELHIVDTHFMIWSAICCTHGGCFFFFSQCCSVLLHLFIFFLFVSFLCVSSFHSR